MRLHEQKGRIVLQPLSECTELVAGSRFPTPSYKTWLLAAQLVQVLGMLQLQSFYREPARSVVGCHDIGGQKRLQSRSSDQPMMAPKCRQNRAGYVKISR